MKIYEIFIRLAVSAAIGLIIGLERERHHRPAGMKTHIMVCMGAAIISLIQTKMVDDTMTIIASNPELANVLKADIGRMGAQVVSGIGFLGAGTILVKKGSVQGLTTAATLWLTACIGLAVGMGYYLISLGSLLIVLLVLLLLGFYQNRSFNKNQLVAKILFSDKKGGMDSTMNYCISRGILIKDLEFVEETDGDSYICYGIYTFQIPRTIDKKAMLLELLREPHILKATRTTE